MGRAYAPGQGKRMRDCVGASRILQKLMTKIRESEGKQFMQIIIEAHSKNALFLAAGRTRWRREPHRCESSCVDAESGPESARTNARLGQNNNSVDQPCRLPQTARGAARPGGRGEPAARPTSLARDARPAPTRTGPAQAKEFPTPNHPPCRKN
jgi:hypothetical protein